MKKEGTVIGSWVGPGAQPINLAVQFDRETQALRLVEKTTASRSHGFWTFFLFVAIVPLVGALIVYSGGRDEGVFLGAGCLIIMVAALVSACEQQVEIDTKANELVRRFRGLFVPWNFRSSIPISSSACFAVDTRRNGDGEDYHVLNFVPFPNAWITLWRPTAIASTKVPDTGKQALERLAYGLNRFLDSVRKGDSNLERLAQPAPPGPFKPQENN